MSEPNTSGPGPNDHPGPATAGAPEDVQSQGTAKKTIAYQDWMNAVSNTLININKRLQELEQGVDSRKVEQEGGPKEGQSNWKDAVLDFYDLAKKKGYFEDNKEQNPMQMFYGKMADVGLTLFQDFIADTSKAIGRNRRSPDGHRFV